MHAAISSDCKPTLLIVDDEQAVLSALNRLLRKDYILLLAQEGQEALRLLKENHVDLILADQKMPQMSGVEFLREAKKIKPDAIRLVLSGYAEAQSVAEAINQGSIYKFFLKPWNDDFLKTSLKEALRYKQLKDDNARLTKELKIKNQALVEALKNQNVRLKENQTTLALLHEVFAILPWPLMGIDENLMIASTNDAAQMLFAPQCLLGESAHFVLPESIVQALKNKEEKRIYCTMLDQQFAVEIKKINSHLQARGFLLLFLDKPQ